MTFPITVVIRRHEHHISLRARFIQMKSPGSQQRSRDELNSVRSSNRATALDPPTPLQHGRPAQIFPNPATRVGAETGVTRLVIREGGPIGSERGGVGDLGYLSFSEWHGRPREKRLLACQACSEFCKGGPGKERGRNQVISRCSVD